MSARPKALPRDLIHRGSGAAAGLLRAERLPGAEETRRRAVALWEPGAIVARVGDRVLVRFSKPRRVRCDQVPGSPLVVAGRAFTEAPLSRADVEALVPPEGAVVVARRGALHLAVPDAVDVASWLDVSPYELLGGAPLGGPPPAVAAPAAGPSDARALFEHAVAAPPPERAGVLAAIAAFQQAPGRAGPNAGAAASPFEGLLAAGVRMLGGLAGLLALAGGTAASGAEPASGRASRGLAVREAAPRGPGWIARLATRLHDLLARALLRTRLARALGRRHAEYVSRMVEAFEQGRLDEALRLAVPLPGKSDGPAPLALTMPSARADLRIRPNAREATSAVFVHEGFGDLGTLYRRAFDRLEREGRIDEAAFVLAELLRADEEAVSFLERHGRHHLAAEMAEARGLPVGLVVRQWFLAGDRDRAVRIARSSGAFADAVLRLERSRSQSAEALRLVWAETLAQAGDFAAAVDVAWPVVQARDLAMAWIDHGLERDGPAAARLMVRKLEGAPGAFAEVRDRCLALLGRRDRESIAERRAFAEALAGSTPGAETRCLAVPAARAVLGDAAARGDASGRALAERLVAFAGDGALRTDLPRWTRRAAPPPEIAFGELRRDALDVGTLAIHDVALLPRGRVLVALGESGARLLGPDGRVLAHFDEPAERLVISDHRDRAIVLARRGRAVRLARLDLATRRAEPWCDAELDAWAPDFDGSQWLVARGGDLFVADALETRLHALHAIPGVGAAAAIARDASGASVLVREPPPDETGSWSGRVERWRFELPGWTLRSRATLPVALSFEGITAVAPYGACVTARSEGAGAGLRLDLHGEAAHRMHRLQSVDGAPTHIAIAENWLAVIEPAPAFVRVELLDQLALRVVGSIHLDGARRAALRLAPASVVIGDDRGRLLVFDLVEGLVSDLRT